MSQALADQLALLPDYLGRHLLLSLTALLAGVALSLPLAFLVLRVPRLRDPVLMIASTIQTVPGLALLALWFASQLNPSLPLLGNVASGSITNVASHPDFAHPRFGFLEMGAVMFTLLSVGLVLAFLVRKSWQALIGTALLALAAGLIKLVAGFLLLKPEARFEWLSREVWIGAGYGLALLGLCLLTSERWRRLMCALALLMVIVLSQVFAREASDPAFLRLFNWRYGQLLNFTGLARTVAQALAVLDARRAFVVHGAGGVDELSPAGPNLVFEVVDGQAHERVIDPAELGLARCEPEELAGGSPAENAAVAREIISGARGPKRDAVILNAGGAVAAAGRAADIAEGIEVAVEAIDSGAAAARLEELIAFSQQSG